METSQNSILADKFVLGQLCHEETLLVEARMLIDPAFRVEISSYRRVYNLVRKYARRNIRKEIIQVQEKLFSSPDKLIFQQKIDHLFKK
jgi:anti-sigma-K factor RskA